MAIKLFERVESGKELFAVETISLIYNALTSFLVLLLYQRMDHPGTMLLERLGIVILTFVLIFLYQAFPCRLTAFVRMVVQMSLLAYWYPDTFEFNRLFPNLDYLFARNEQALFGCQPSVEFSEHCPSIWFSEPFNMGYFFLLSDDAHCGTLLLREAFRVVREDLLCAGHFVLHLLFGLYYVACGRTAVLFPGYWDGQGECVRFSSYWRLFQYE